MRAYSSSKRKGIKNSQLVWPCAVPIDSLCTTNTEYK
uniref:Uncharacterized protein n=1 Tax=Arundo donax TaxID=35708 RepID=A0A0A9EE18_ARUDO